MNITRRDLEHAWNTAQSVHRRLSGHKGMIEAGASAFTTQAESGLAAFGYGVLEGRHGPVKIGPVSADLLAAAVLHGVGVFGLAGEYGGHLSNFANGLLDGYLHRMGIGLGASMAQKAGRALPSVADPKGAFHFGARSGMNPRRGDEGRRTGVGARRAQPMSDGELAALMMNAR